MIVQRYRLKHQLSGLCLLVSALLLSCTARSTTDRWSLDTGLFTDQPCRAPCWNNLTPGQSSLQDAAAFINSLNSSDWAGRVDKTFPDGCERIRISDVVGNYVHYSVVFQIRDNELVMIDSLASGLPNLGQVVDRFGPPEFVRAESVSGPSGTGYGIDVYYPQRGLAFQVETTPKDLGQIRRDMAISQVEYFAPTDLLSYLIVKSYCHVPYAAAVEGARRIAETLVQAWPGFGSVTPVVVPGP